MSSIGVFWIYDNRIFLETQKIIDLKPINGYIDSDLAHYEVWDSVKYQHSKFFLFEYEDVPRGRVIYDVKNKRFVVYCNPYILQNKTEIKLILEGFQLSNMNSIFIEDEHYKI